MAKWKGDDNGMCRCFYLHPVKTEEIFSARKVLEVIKNGKKPKRGNKAKIGSYIED